MYTNANPFTFGALALDEAFTDRTTELSALVSDLRNGQDVVIFAPRRYGKSSLVLRASQEVLAHDVLVGYCDLMRTPTKERFAAALAKTIFEDVASPVGQIVERAAALFRGLRVRPTMEVDSETGGLRFGFDPAPRKADIDETIEKLLELPAALAAERKRRVALVFDEFQEVIALDPSFPNLMRAVFQTQPEVGHVYLGSKRHVLEQIFSDRNEPFWRSAKRVELGVIAPGEFAPFVNERFQATEKGIRAEALARLVEATAGHPYATQELAYFVWELVPRGHFATVADVDAALAQVLRSEHNHLTRIWDEATRNERLVMLALAFEPSARLYSEDYRARHGLPASTFVQRALVALSREEIVGRESDDRAYRIVEPFLAEWLRREQM
ncbi:MAG: ATP-binding protein [Thermoleophilia bacterium]|nr:ATP-binding protein [Thermoleophilia bacterium]